MNIRTFVVLLALLAACRIVSPASLPTGDAGPSDRGAVVCSQLRKLGCPEGSPSPKGETCEALYARVPDALDGRCIVAATTVAEVQDCDVRCGSEDVDGGPF